MTYFVDAWNLFSLVALLSIGPETKNNLNLSANGSEKVGKLSEAFDAMSGSADRKI